MVWTHRKSIRSRTNSLVHCLLAGWPGHFSACPRRFISFTDEGTCLITEWQPTNVEKETACHRNNIAKHIAWINPLFPSSTFMLLTCVMHTLPLITRSSWVESALRITHVSVCVFHLVNSRKQCRNFVLLLYRKPCVGNLLFLPFRYSYHSTKVKISMYRSFQKRLSYIKLCVSLYITLTS
jgi:hypothetical protein